MTQPQAHPATVVSAGQVQEEIVTKHLQPSELSSALPRGLVMETVKRGMGCLFALLFPSVPQKHTEGSPRLREVTAKGSLCATPPHSVNSSAFAQISTIWSGDLEVNCRSDSITG